MIPSSNPAPPARALTDPSAIDSRPPCRFNRIQIAGRPIRRVRRVPPLDITYLPSRRQLLLNAGPHHLSSAAGFPTQINPNMHFQQTHRLPTSTAHAEQRNPVNLTEIQMIRSGDRQSGCCYFSIVIKIAPVAKSSRFPFLKSATSVERQAGVAKWQTHRT